MRRTARLAGALVVLLLVGGCGGLRGDEKTAADNLASSFAGKDPSKERTAIGRCFGTTVVREAGLDQLKKDKVVDAQLKPASMVPKSLSQKTAEAYADGVVDCFDFTKLKADFKKEYGASTAQVAAYVTCLGKIDKDDLKQSIVDQYTKSSVTSVRKKIDTATKTCAKKLGA